MDALFIAVVNAAVTKVDYGILRPKSCRWCAWTYARLFGLAGVDRQCTSWSPPEHPRTCGSMVNTFPCKEGVWCVAGTASGCARRNAVSVAERCSTMPSRGERPIGSRSAAGCARLGVFVSDITDYGGQIPCRNFRFGEDFNKPVDGLVWPTSLHQLSVVGKFNQPIAGIAWPASLQKLSFGTHFNQPVAGVVWPAYLQQLSFGKYFNQSIAGVVWPASLEKLEFGDCFN